MADAVVLQRIDDGVDHRRGRADRPDLAAAFGAQRVVGAHGVLGGHRHRWDVVGAGHRVVHERARQQLAAGVIQGVFQQRLADALGDAALNLALDDHRVDHAADVVDGGEVDHLHDAGFGVDFDLGDVAAAGEGEVLGIVEGGFVQAGFDFIDRVVVRDVGRQRDVSQGF